MSLLAGVIEQQINLWTPDILFSNGEDGSYFFVTPETVWQEAAGTNPGVVGSPVGKLDDQSGNGGDLTDANLIRRPILRIDGNDNHYLDSDGVDDRLQNTTVPALINPPVDILFAGRRVSGNAVIDSGNSVNRNLIWNAGAAVMWSGTQQTVNDTLTDLAVYTARFNGTSSSFRKNGVEIATPSIGARNQTGLTILNTRAGNQGSVSEIYALICREALSADELASAETWLGKKIGVDI